MKFQISLGLFVALLSPRLIQAVTLDLGATYVVSNADSEIEIPIYLFDAIQPTQLDLVAQIFDSASTGNAPIFVQTSMGVSLSDTIWGDFPTAIPLTASDSFISWLIQPLDSADEGPGVIARLQIDVGSALPGTYQVTLDSTMLTTVDAPAGLTVPMDISVVGGMIQVVPEPAGWIASLLWTVCCGAAARGFRRRALRMPD